MKLTKELKENIDLYLKTKTPKELLHLFKKYGIEEIPKQLILSGVVSSKFLCGNQKRHPLKRCKEQCSWCEGNE
jgi:hypothetical protein